MPTTVNLRPLLDRKQWEMCSFAPVSSGAATVTSSSSLKSKYTYCVLSATVFWIYDTVNDGWFQGPSPALAGTYGVGADTTFHEYGSRGFPTAGTTTTITTGLNLQKSIAGYKIRIIAGPNAGVEKTILSNTTGAASVITVDSAYGTAITTASEFILMTGRLWVVGAGTLAAGSFRYFDVALNTWVSASQTGLPATIGTDGKLISTERAFSSPITGTATAGAATTLTDTTKTFEVNGLSNYQVRITAGTGAGQFRTIASNTATVLTVSASWTTNPDATSVYVIEGNSDFLYYMGNNAVTLYRYSISANTWTTLSPTVARAGAPVAGMTANWVYNATGWSATNSFLNGRYIFSFRGNAVTLDRYDIASNTWVNDIPYFPKTETIAAGTVSRYDGGDYIHLMLTTGRTIRYNPVESRIEGGSQLFYVQGAAIVGDRIWFTDFVDGATTVKFLYYWSATQNILFRQLQF